MKLPHIPRPHLPPSIIDRDAPLTPFERVAAFLILVGAIAAVYAVGAILGGGQPVTN